MLAVHPAERRNLALVCRPSHFRQPSDQYVAIRKAGLVENPCTQAIGGQITSDFSLGHDARLMPAKYVRPYSKGQKNDFRDAEAIAEDPPAAFCREALSCGMTP